MKFSENPNSQPGSPKKNAEVEKSKEPNKDFSKCDHCGKSGFKKEADFDDHLAKKCKMFTTCPACKDLLLGVDFR